MKTKFLLITVSLIAILAVQAQQPKQVTWDMLNNPLTTGDLPSTGAGMMIWGDYNNDGWLDAFIVSGQGSSTEVIGLYKNNGNNTFTEIPMADFFSLVRGSALFIDYDNDGDLDLLVTGSMMGMPITLLFQNSGAPDYIYTEVESAADIFPPISIENNDDNPRALVAFDYNNDGWTDILFNGNTLEKWDELGESRVVALFKNNQGTFELQKTPLDGTANFRAVNGGSVNVGDVNNDGYADLIITGYADGGIQTITDLYINNKNETFSRWEASETTFTGHQQGETFFVDVNNDGWLDIIEIGRDVRNGWAAYGNLYINNKDLTFTTLGSDVTNLPGGQAVVAIGDINNDGWMDIFASGWATGAKHLYNNGDNSFTVAPQPANETCRGGFTNYVDFNNDNSLDFTVFGYSDNLGGWFHAFYKNDLGEGIPANNPPSAPTNVRVARDNGKYILSWNKATDDHTPQDAIRYNVSIDFKNGKKYVYVPADLTSGKVKVNGLQPFITSTSIEFNLPEGDYSFAVQAIDQAHVGSAFTVASTGGTGIEKTIFDKVQVNAWNNIININNSDVVNVDYKILSINGQIIEAGKCNPGSTVFSDSLPFGVYMVRLSKENHVSTVKILVY